MGVDIIVQAVLMMCPYLGKPYYYRHDKNTKQLEKVYGLPEIVVPEEWRRFLSFKNNILSAYLENMPAEAQTASVEAFLEQFPSWEDVLLGYFFDETSHWSQEEHYAFKALLEWLSHQEVCFQVTWSY